MVSAWWLLVAFLGGGFAGVLLLALMQVAGGLLEHEQYVGDPAAHPGSNAGVL